MTIDADQYRAALKQRWVGVHFSDPVDKNYVLEWTLPPSRLGFAGLQGWLSVNCQIVTIGSGPKESFLDFILWHRGFVPAEFDLYLFSSVSEETLILKQDTSKQTIIDFTGIID